MSSEPVPFGRYQLLSLLGEGGMAKVFRATLSGPMGFEKEVALKRLDPRMTEDERVVKALINEARLGGQLRHKNIVEIYEFNQVDGHYFMAMEFVDGWTLEDILKHMRSSGERIPSTVIADVLIQACRGLNYAHTLISKEGQALRLVHRDLKPGNMIISREGDVKIMDFGIAKSDTNLYKTTAADVTKGTPVYMSPEQVTGADLDCRSDIFSMGSVLHELVTQRVPFSGDNLLALMHSVLHADITQPRLNVQEVEPAFLPILELCMAKDPDQRFSTAAELESALRDLKRKLPQGPDLEEWIVELRDVMPGPKPAGEFGPDGAPTPMAAGTLSIDPLAATGEVDSFGDTVDVQATTGRARTAQITGEGRATGRRRRTTAAGAAAPRSGDRHRKTTGGTRKVDDPNATRAAPALGTQSGVRRKTAAHRKVKKRSNGLLIGALVVFGVGLVAVAFQLGRRDADDPVASAEQPTAGEALAPLEVEARPTPAAEAAAEPAPAPGKEAPEASEPSRPKPERGTTTKTVATREPRQKPPREEPPPEPVEAAPAEPVPHYEGTGWADFNSKPWSMVLVDGRVISSQTPVMGYELPAGPHTVTFDCTASCDPPQKKTIKFVVEAGRTTKQIHKFKPPGGK